LKLVGQLSQCAFVNVEFRVRAPLPFLWTYGYPNVAMITGKMVYSDVATCLAECHQNSPTFFKQWANKKRMIHPNPLAGIRRFSTTAIPDPQNLGIPQHLWQTIGWIYNCFP